MITAPVPHLPARQQAGCGSARYYDSRIANWTSTDPLFEKHYGWSPYNYVLREPMIVFDPNGKQELALGKAFGEMMMHAGEAMHATKHIPTFGELMEQYGEIQLEDRKEEVLQTE